VHNNEHAAGSRAKHLMLKWRQKSPIVFVGVILSLSIQAVNSAATVLPAQVAAATVTEPPPEPLPDPLSAALEGRIPDMDTTDDQSTAPAATSLPGPASRQVSWRELPSNILHDQKDIWLFPLQLAHGHHWFPTIAVIGITTGLVALDSHDTPYFRRTSDFAGFNRGFSGSITEAEIAVVPAAMYGIGLIRKDSYAQQTALFSAEAVVDSGILDIAMKDVSRRLRPSDIAPTGDFSDTFFRSPATITGKNSGFPSGHTILAFSVATVIARRYGKNHRWVPWVAYGAAGAIGFSRVSLQSHFPSDVFLGAALGYAVARFGVLHNQ
jgi:membrane-associated phospholipid phosphatase